MVDLTFGSHAFWVEVGIMFVPVLVYVYFGLLPRLRYSKYKELRMLYLFARAGIMLEVSLATTDLIASAVAFWSEHPGDPWSLMFLSRAGGQGVLAHTPDYLALMLVFWTCYLATESEVFSALAVASLVGLHEVPWGPIMALVWYKELFAQFAFSNMAYTLILLVAIYLWYRKWSFEGQKKILLGTLVVVLAFDMVWLAGGFPITVVGSTPVPSLYLSALANEYEVLGWLLPAAVFEAGLILCFGVMKLRRREDYRLYLGLNLKTRRVTEGMVALFSELPSTTPQQRTGRLLWRVFQRGTRPGGSTLPSPGPQPTE